MRIYDDAGLEAVKGYMGTTFPLDEKAYKCHDKHKPENASLCLEWMHRGRFSLSMTQNGKLRCYRVLWQSLSPETHPTDCFEMNTHLWYGGGAILGRHYDFAGWPLNKAQVPMTPFVTGSEVRGHNGWGPVLRRHFLSSKAAAVIVDDAVPLWVSINSNHSQKLCLQARSNSYPFNSPREDDAAASKRHANNNNGVFSVLNYTICTSTDLETLQTSLADTNMWDGLRRDEMEVIVQPMA